MAKSINDIPTIYRGIEHKSLFLAWIKDLPVTNNIKRNLLTIWRFDTMTTLTITDYKDAGITK